MVMKIRALNMDQTAMMADIVFQCNIHYTVRCHYDMVNFLKNINKRQPIAHPLIDILPQFLQLLMQYLTTLTMLYRHLTVCKIASNPQNELSLNQYDLAMPYSVRDLDWISSSLCHIFIENAQTWMIWNIWLDLCPQLALHTRLT